MGWLEELANGAKYGTLGKLARAAVKHQDWPGDESQNDRSVENMLRLVDQKQRKGQVWLDHRPEVRDVIAELLGVSPEILDPGAQEPEGLADPRVELRELRESRPIDLRKEPLFPGIPAEIFDPELWDRTWWLAESGAGRTLAGRWLEARKLATFLRGARLADVLPHVPAEGAVYIEVQLSDATDAAIWADHFEGRAVCVAAPFVPAPPSDADESSSEKKAKPWFEDQPADDAQIGPDIGDGWALVETSPFGEWRAAMIEWVGSRMRAGGGFVVAEALALLSEKGWEAIVRTPGDCIGICGVLEKLGPKIQTAGADDIATAFLEARMERSDLGRRGAWTPADLSKLLSGCTEAALLHSGTVDFIASEQTLKASLPTDALPPGDDTVLLQLIEQPPDDMAAVRAVIKRARPSVNAAIHELFRLHLLEHVAEGAVAIRPAWLAHVVAVPARARLLAEPSRGFGHSFLGPQAARWPLTLLSNAFDPRRKVLGESTEHANARGAEAAGWGVVRFATRAVSVEDPASVALLEATFLSAGIALLDPEVPAPAAELRALWDAQMRFAVARYENAPPQPRLIATESHTTGWRGAWYTAALAISERLFQVGTDIGVGPLAPWGGSEAQPLVEQALHGLENMCVVWRDSARPRKDIGSEPPFRLQAWRLGGRYFRKFGASDHHLTGGLFAPFTLFEAMKSGQPSVYGGRLRTDFDFEALAALAADAEIEMHAVLAVLWRTKNMHGEPILLQNGEASMKWLSAKWAALPPELIRTELKGRVEQHEGLLWPILSDEQWTAVLDVWAENRNGFRQGVEHLPASAAARVIRERLTGTNALENCAVIWKKHASLAVQESIRELRSPTTDHSRNPMIWSTPKERVDEVVEAVLGSLDIICAVPANLRSVLGWAHHQVSQRGPHWLAAWKLLNEVSPVAS